MKIIRMLAASAVLAGGAVTTTLASATTVVFAGDTTGAPTFSRPNANGDDAPFQTSGPGFMFQSFDFTVDIAGSYVFDLASGYDNYLILYQGLFTPTSPLTNAIEADDDDGPGLDAQIIRDLAIGTGYTIVASSFSGESGPFALTVNGPGTATLGQPGAVPEPAAWAMMMLGIGLIGGAARYRRGKAAVSFA